VRKISLALIVLAALAPPAGAYHRQTPPIVAITSSGDNPLPRVPAGGLRLVLALNGSGRQIFRQHRRKNFLEQITTAGDNANPTTSKNASVIAWDSDCALLGCGDPGRQIFMWTKHGTFQASHDSSGTSINAALSGRGDQLAWESQGNLEIGGSNSGAWQIFARGRDGIVRQVSHGLGTSVNAAYDLGGRNLVFESTSAPNGTDTTVAQIWLESIYGQAAPITSGASGSHAPAISADGHVIAFHSTAALTTDLQDTMVNQIFVYQTPGGSITKITDDGMGCSGASVSASPGDYRIGYVCDRADPGYPGGVRREGFFHYLVADQAFRLPIPTGTDTPQAIAELGGHFMMVSTDANLFGTGKTPGHELYLLNLFKLVAEPLP
jgi:hypothetical protein